MTQHIRVYADDKAPIRIGSAAIDLLRRVFLSRIGDLRNINLRVLEDDREPLLLGDRQDSQFDIVIHDPLFYAYACLGGSVGVGEAYMLGLWESDDLVNLVRLFIRNRDNLETMDSGLGRLKKPLLKLFELRRRNHRQGSRLNIAAHYDLGNDFFRLFLDESMTYSSAIYARPEDSLEAAQQNKLDIVCRKLGLQPGDHLIEIGTGWGALAIHAAGQYGARVTTTTISQEQYDLASERIKAAGLADRIELLQCDYRELSGTYDKLVSIEMIEAVGHDYYPQFLGQCDALLKRDGQALIQAITTRDQIYHQARKEADFIRRYIFPGGNLPSVTHLLEVATDTTSLRLFHLDDFSADYARTLSQWRERFWTRAEAIRSQGYSEIFMRMWDYYLAICEAAFAEHHTGVVHMLFTKPGCIRGAVS